ncbi:MAG: hypothetical protein ABJF10_11570 [Chthoniobacter sp.]|uniref:hypothetical protein n=1 Tax=Chthoniobacter sp. TaxID=2510640 RepID=UPI0032A93A79
MPLHRPILLILFLLTCGAAPVLAGPKAAKKPPTPLDFGITPQTPRLIEFQNDDLALALQVLARNAKVTIAVSEDIKDTISMRLENKTPREAIDIIIATKDLVLDEQKGTLFIRPKNPPAAGVVKAGSADPFNLKDLAGAFTPALTGMYDSLLDYAARPETAQKLAKATKALFDALIAEGFTKEEAFQIILSDHGLPAPGANK